MNDRMGSLLVWLLFLGAVWLWARPILVFLAAVLILGGVLLGVIKKLEDQSKELARSWKKEDEDVQRHRNTRE